MNVLLSDDKIIQEIKAYHTPNWIWIDIWEVADYEIQIVITVNDKEQCRLNDHKVIKICSAKTNEDNDVSDLKKYGKRIVRLIRRNFPNSEVHSKLYYR